MGEFFGGNFNPQHHKFGLGLGGFINLRTFYHFHKDVALMLGYDFIFHSQATISIENNISVGLAF